jgi:hypothetical protein
MLTRDVSSRQILSCDHFCTSVFNLLSSFQKVNNVRRKQSLSSFVSRQVRLFSPRSPSRPLSRRVAHHPERRLCSLLFLAVRPVRLVKWHQPTFGKPTRFSCVAKRPPHIAWTAALGQRPRGPVRRLNSLGVGGKCRAFNRRDEAAGEGLRGLKGSDEPSEVAPEDRPNQSGKRPVTRSKGELFGKEGIEHLSHSRSDKTDFLDVKTFIQS